MSYERCPLCKGKGLLKKESCPVCLGERIINEEDGTPPSKHCIPYIVPYIPCSPYSTYPWINPTITFGTDVNYGTVTSKVYPSTFTTN